MSLPRPHRNRFLPWVNRTKTAVDRRLQRVLDGAERSYGQEGAEVAAMLQATRSLTLRGGKRLRAALLVVGASVASGPRPKRDAVLAAASALELLQAYFLIHDDWMDQDATRRGGPTVHAALTERFGQAHLGACSAVLGGDFLVALATEEFSRCLRAHPAAETLVATFARLQLEAVTGQQLDVIGETRDAERIYALKTSSYSVAGPLKLGAQLAGAPPALVNSLVRFGEPVGLAFQIRDDLLSLFGDSAVTGKPLGNDLRAGKWTFTVQAALRTGAAKQVRACLGNAKATDGQVKKAIDAIRTSGAYDLSLERIDALCAKARSELQKAPLRLESRHLLDDAIATLVDRTS